MVQGVNIGQFEIYLSYMYIVYIYHDAPDKYQLVLTQNAVEK